MDILIIGNGGREHAIATALKKSPKVDKLYCIKGNGGISEIAECVDIDIMDNDKIVEFVKTHKSIEMTVVAPDDPLANGLVDALIKNGLRAFGPSKRAALIESSKAFSKDLMKKYHIPTAKYEVFDNYELALNYIEKEKFPLVIKADGLALGKGVLICKDFEEGKDALKEIMLDNSFGAAGKTVVIEEFLTGKEVSILAFTDGKTIVPMISSQDHKRAYDNDEGLNTGGMGTFSPSKIYTKEVEEFCNQKVFLPTVNAMNSEGRTFKGVLYFGLMLTDDGVKVLEYNARFGDPETQVVLPLLDSDLYEIFDAVIDGRLDEIDVKWSNDSAVCVILASGGYPKNYKKGIEITVSDMDKDIVLYHAGTAVKDGKLVTNGGRVIGVTAKGKNIDECREKVYNNIDKIKFDGMHYRKDIGKK